MLVKIVAVICHLAIPGSAEHPATPEVCEDHFVGASDGGLPACVMAQPLIADWMKQNGFDDPTEYHLDRWKCFIGAPPKRNTA